MKISATPSIAFSVTLPVNPSQTMTSVVPRGMSRPSTLPRKSRSSAAASSACTSCVSALPLPASSPIESSPIVGVRTSRIAVAKADPM